MKLTLEPETHTYRKGERVYPSITQVIKALRIGRDHSFTHEFYSARGRANHKAIELYDNCDLDESSIDPAVRPYLQAYVRFRDDTGFEPVYSELMLCSDEDGFAGTLDKVGRLPGLGLGILEIKTTESIDSSALKAQLSGQSRLWAANYPRRPIRWKYGLQLRQEGPPALITKFTDTPDAYWLGLLIDYREGK